MQNKVFFLNDVRNLPPTETPERTILVWHPMYTPPEIPGVEYVEWDKFRIIYSQFEPRLVILVGLNRMITPSNRCDYVHEYLTTMTPNIPKISIDTAPFIGEPWRLFFHYLYAGVNNFGVNYSYPVEREWQDWFYRETNDCRLSGENVRLFIRETYSELSKLKTSFVFSEPIPDDLDWYSEVKQFVFSKYNTPKLLVANLLKLCNQRFQTSIDFNSYLSGETIHLPDLPIFRFMAEETIRRRDIFNAFTNEEIQRK